MSEFIQSLESRTFLSASPIIKATLVADKATIAADASSASAALKVLVADLKSNVIALTGDLKTLPKTNAALLKTLKSGEAAAKATLNTELNFLLKPATALVKKSVTTGESLLKKSTVKNLAVLSVEITALGNVTTAPEASLAAGLSGTTLQTDLNALVAANPGASVLTSDVATALGDITTETAFISTDAANFASDIARLATDLSSLQTAVGTFPNVAGSFSGNAIEVGGKHPGRSASVNIDITSEDASGNLVGTVTDIFNGGLDPLVGTVSLNGFVTLRSSPGTGAVKISGPLSGSTISGGFSFAGGRGTFIVTEG